MVYNQRILKELSEALKDRQYNNQRKNDKMTNNDLQNTTQKTYD